MRGCAPRPAIRTVAGTGEVRNMSGLRWTITVEALADSVPPDRRLAKALKGLLRAYRLRVVAVEPADRHDPCIAAPAPNGNREERRIP